MDVTTPIRRLTMQAVKSKNTTPELIVRRLLHLNGYRYQLHRTDLPGCPDIVFSRKKKIIFIHGCFWHGHACRRGARTPKTNKDYWIAKIERNRNRDSIVSKELSASGWKLAVIWECETKNEPELLQRISQFLMLPATTSSF